MVVEICKSFISRLKTQGKKFCTSAPPHNYQNTYDRKIEFRDRKYKKEDKEVEVNEKYLQNINGWVWLLWRIHVTMHSKV